MAKLKPCPFCGGEAKYIEGYQRAGGEWIRGLVICRECGVGKSGKDMHKSGFLSNKEESELSLTAIEAWNTRAERTCGLRSRLTGMYCYECSKCGRGMKADWAYCPKCGAKVVE